MTDSGRVIPFRKPARKTRKCPICGDPTAHEYAPFCSRRCSDVDLSRWLTGHYVIAGSDSASSEDEEDA